jgi:ankyrin repeat protein
MTPQTIALFEAAERGDLEAADALLANGADVLAFDEDLAWTALHYAAKGGHLALVQHLLAAGAEVNRHDEARIGETALGLIAGNCTLRMAKLLVEAGANPILPGWMGVTALDRASQRKRGDGPAVHALLLETARNRFGYCG